MSMGRVGVFAAVLAMEYSREDLKFLNDVLCDL